ncbi:hypothetical protein Tco_0291701 [Tanacetum coccineum]
MDLVNTGGTVSHRSARMFDKYIYERQLTLFSGTEGVVGLKRWFEKMEQVFEICKCAEDDKSNVKAMMTTAYCPATEIQRMEQELWTLTLKGDDIEAYNKFDSKKLRGIKGNVTSSKPATLHDAINMARELIEQGVQAKALRIGDSNKRKWERTSKWNKLSPAENRRQEAVRIYVAAPARVEAGLGTYHGEIGARNIISQWERRVAKAIEKYEKTRADSNNTGGSGSTNTGGTVAPEVQGCSYKTFMNGKPHSFNGTEGVVGLKRWFEKIEQVFSFVKCAKDDKVKFAMLHVFGVRALTWWERNVQTLGLCNATQIPWGKFNKKL